MKLRLSERRVRGVEQRVAPAAEPGCSAMCRVEGVCVRCRHKGRASRLFACPPPAQMQYPHAHTRLFSKSCRLPLPPPPLPLPPAPQVLWFEAVVLAVLVAGLPGEGGGGNEVRCVLATRPGPGRAGQPP